MFSKLTIAMGFAFICVSVPAAADDSVVSHMTDAQMKAAMTGPGGAAAATPIGLHDGYQVQLLQRTQSGRVEQHFDWNEYLIVQDGDATLNYGGASVNAQTVRPGEMMGDSISNGASAQIHKGDVVVIPAGTPHQMVLAPGTTIRYLDFKGRKTNSSSLPKVPR